MTNTPIPQANTLDEQIRKAIKAYKIAGGDPEFYIISKSDHDRNWAQAVTEARIDGAVMGAKFGNAAFRQQNIAKPGERINLDTVLDSGIEQAKEWAERNVE